MSKREIKAKPVGYCSPPVETRFRKGQSGNPNGRPPKSRSGVERDELAQLLHNVNRVFIGGKALEVRRIDILLQSMKKRALAGDYKAAVDLLQLHRGRQQRFAPARRWLTRPSTMVVPQASHSFAEWCTLIGDAKTPGLVSADTQGHWLVRPDWLRAELKARDSRGGRRTTSEKDKATARLFSTKVSVILSGVQSRVALSRALYSVLIDVGQKNSAAWKAINKMEEEATTSKIAVQAEAAGAKHGVLIVPQAPHSIEEWTRQYGRKASGEWAREQLNV